MLIDQVTPQAYAAFVTEFNQYAASTVYNGASNQMVMWGNYSIDESKTIANFFAIWDLNN